MQTFVLIWLFSLKFSISLKNVSHSGYIYCIFCQVTTYFLTSPGCCWPYVKVTDIKISVTNMFKFRVKFVSSFAYCIYLNGTVLYAFIGLSVFIWLRVYSRTSIVQHASDFQLLFELSEFRTFESALSVLLEKSECKK